MEQNFKYTDFTQSWNISVQSCFKFRLGLIYGSPLLITSILIIFKVNFYYDWQNWENIAMAETNKLKPNELSTLGSLLTRNLFDN